MKKLYYIIYIGIFMLLLAGCQDEGMFTPSEEKGIVTYSIRMDDGLQSRSIGDETIVNNLSILVFDKNKTLVLKKDNLNWNNLKPEDLQFSLLKGEYQVLFWLQYAENNENTYTIDDNGKVYVEYNNNWAGSIEDMEKWDAFYYVDELEINNDAQTKPISLTRPLGQLNWADSQLFPSTHEHSVVITLSGIATSFDPFPTEESEVQPLTEKDEITFTFNAFTDIPLNTKDGNYYYLSCNYLFPTKLTATFELQDNEGNSLKKVGIEEPLTIEIVSNTRTNVLGSTVLKPEAPETNGAWDGITLTTPESEDDCYIIDEPSDLAWLGSDKNTLEKACTLKVVKNIDMNCTEETENSLKSLALPAGSIFMGVADENNVSPCISNIKLTKGGLFGDATNITVQNLNLDNVKVTSEGHVGVLVNTLIGNGTFTNVSISNSSATTTNGAAGGMVGYIVRASETDRSETLEVKIENCNISQTIVSSDKENEGQFVGLLSGYDNGEKLTFKTCTATDVQVPGTYHDFLGNETYRRGAVTVEDKRFMPKWDGKTTVDPLLANPTYDGANAIAGTNKFVVYSSFDLAGVRKKIASPAAIYLKADIDMNGQGADGKYNVPSNFTQSAYSSTDDNNFTPFEYVATFDGYKDDVSNYSIYNLSIAQIEQERAAFILYAPGTTVHKNINFRNCQTVAVHKPVTTDAKAYGAILVSNVDATTYTMENVHAYDCKVFALQKIGTLGARISGTSTLNNNSVNNCYVENYECNISERFTSGKKTISRWTVEVYADFYPHGEVGGMYGFIQGSSTLTKCKVNGTTIYAYGQDDKMATVDGSGLAQAGIALLGYYKVPGRHVSTLIGNIRATGTVTLTGCGVDANTKCTMRHDNHNNTYNYIGQAYIVKFVDSEGSVTVDGKKLKLADCNKNTKR